MKIILAIGTGSFIGGAGRYILSQIIQQKYISAFPWATFCVNIIGCLLIGIVFGISERGNINSEWRLFLATGVLGGFTTFSAFSNETFGLIRTGYYGYAVIYILASVLVGLLATWMGYALLKLG